MALPSCRAISSFLHDDEVVAEVSSQKLFRSDIDQFIPNGISGEDSIRLAMQYINTWAADIVYQEIAEEQLSKAEQDVTKELEEYRKSLLKYRYEQLYVNERLDTAVSDDLIEDYYLSHKDKFILERPVLKARYLHISADSPTMEQIRRRMSSSEIDDLIEADSLAYHSAMEFSIWNDSWIDITTLSRKFSLDQGTLLSMRKGDWIEFKDSTGMAHIAFIPEIVSKGEIAPLEYAAPMIRDIVISSRKQSLITSLEMDLLNDARENGKFVIY